MKNKKYFKSFQSIKIGIPIIMVLFIFHVKIAQIA